MHRYVKESAGCQGPQDRDVEVMFNGDRVSVLHLNKSVNVLIATELCA